MHMRRQPKYFRNMSSYEERDSHGRLRIRFSLKDIKVTSDVPQQSAHETWELTDTGKQLAISQELFNGQRESSALQELLMILHEGVSTPQNIEKHQRLYYMLCDDDQLLSYIFFIKNLYHLLRNAKNKGLVRLVETNKHESALH